MPTEPYKSPSGELSERKFQGQLDSIEGHWVGKEKERYDFTLKLLEKKTTTRGYFVYRMTDKFGNLYIAFDGRENWFTEGLLAVLTDNTLPVETAGHNLQDGDCFTCKATVNRHDIADFKYGGPDSHHKQTVLNRIKLKSFIGRK